MPRSARIAPAGWVFHVLNRANARAKIFGEYSDYSLFQRTLSDAVEKYEVELLGYCVMPNHWHLVVCPRLDGELARFMQWLSVTHTRRWHLKHGTSGSGHLYQGRYKSFPIQTDEHLITVLRYVERNPLRAALVARAEDWPWSSLPARLLGNACTAPRRLFSGLVDLPSGWRELVNAALTEDERQSVARSIEHNRPFGDPLWTEAATNRLGLTSTLRSAGRPRK